MPGRVARRHGATAPPLEGAIWVESIPFNETRDYVKKVLANAMFYARELELPYVTLAHASALSRRAAPPQRPATAVRR